MVAHRYTKEEVDWIGVYDATTDRCFYVPSVVWDGQLAISLRVVPTINGQAKVIRYAKDFTRLIGNPGSSGSVESQHLPLGFPPE